MYACKAESSGGGRCRNSAGTDGFCSSHSGKKVKVAGKPDKVLVKANINPNWTRRFIELGIRVVTPDFARHEAEHVAHAQEHGRGAFTVRKNIADSGVPVFGKEGVTVGVSVVALIDELSKSYKIVDVHIFQKPADPSRGQKGVMSTLVVSFAKEGEAIMPNTVLEFYAMSKWDFVHVWANPPKEDGTVIHTVNLAHRADAQAEHELRFADGLWAVESC